MLNFYCELCFQLHPNVAWSPFNLSSNQRNGIYHLSASNTLKPTLKFVWNLNSNFDRKFSIRCHEWEEPFRTSIAKLAFLISPPNERLFANLIWPSCDPVFDLVSTKIAGLLLYNDLERVASRKHHNKMQLGEKMQLGGILFLEAKVIFLRHINACSLDNLRPGWFD